MRYNLFFLCLLPTILSSCISGNNDDMYVFHCDDADFTFSIHERNNGHVLYFGEQDSVITNFTANGSYYGIDFYLLEGTNTIYIKGESAGLERSSESDSTLHVVNPPQYPTVSHKYNIKYLTQNVTPGPNFLEYDYSVLGNDYWEFHGNLSERGDAYTFRYGKNKDASFKTIKAEF